MIEAGRRALAVKYHPDRGDTTEIMAEVNRAADALLALIGRATLA